VQPIRIRRWTVEIYRRAIHITHLADPKCSRCHGNGAVTENTGALGPEYDLCDCWDPRPIARIPLWTRRTEKAPF
jgi:hypothetical protein